MLPGLFKALSAGGKAVGGVGKEIYKRKRKELKDTFGRSSKSNGSLGERRRKERER